MRDRLHDDAMAEVLRDDPTYAAQLLSCILEDGDEGELRIALRHIIAAHDRNCVDGRFDAVPERLLSSLPGDGGVRLADLIAAIEVLGLRLVIEPRTGG